MEGHRVSRAIRGESVEIGLVVPASQKHRLPAVAPRHDVIEKPWTEDAAGSSHAPLAERVPAPKASSRKVKVKA
jgi:hypothetical protein